MKQACLVLISLFVFAQPANAVFRAPRQARTEQAATTPAQGNLQPDQPAPSTSPFREKRRLRGPRLNDQDRYNITTPGTFSLVCAALGLAFIAGVGITSFGLLVIPVFIFATLATVFGAIGIKRHKPGYAIAGMSLGLLEIVGGFMLLVLLL
jgi:hypothetical protein